VDGYLYPHEAVFLRRLARDLPLDPPIVEVGSYRGRSTLCLASGLRERGRGRVVSVDPHVYGTEAQLRENLDHFGLSAWVEVIVGPSVEVAAGWTGPVSAVFVDGNHALASVEADVEAWLPHLVPGGFLLLHDAAGPAAFAGPKAVAERLFCDRARFDATGTLGSVHWGRCGGGIRSWVPVAPGARLLDALLRPMKSVRGG